MKLSNRKIFIIGFVIWPLVIAIPQFNTKYSLGLISGKLSHGQIPVEFYLGLFSGVFVSLVFLGLGYTISSLINRIFKITTKGPTVYLYITCFFFTLLIITQSVTFFRLINLDKEHVRKLRERIIEYEENVE